MIYISRGSPVDTFQGNAFVKVKLGNKLKCKICSKILVKLLGNSEDCNWYNAYDYYFAIRV